MDVIDDQPQPVPQRGHVRAFVTIPSAGTPAHGSGIQTTERPDPTPKLTYARTAYRKAAQADMRQNVASETGLTSEVILAQMETGREVAISYTISEDAAHCVVRLYPVLRELALRPGRRCESCPAYRQQCRSDAQSRMRAVQDLVTAAAAGYIS